MKNLVILNGSPRKKFNTAKLLKEVQLGAESVGANVDYYDLIDLNYKGCVSCFACKRKGSVTNGLCAYKDELTPVLEKIINSDGVILGSPIYYSYPTGMFRSVVERMLFAAGSYMIGEDTVLKRTIPVGLIYTMNVTEDGAKLYNYPEILAPIEEYMKYIYGHSETIYVYDTYQFTDYSQYNCDMFDEYHKAEVRDTQFPIDMQKAYEMGARFGMYN